MPPEKLLVSMFGGQPMPALLMAAQFHPEVVWCVCSPGSKPLVKNLVDSLSFLQSPPRVEAIEVHAYDFAQIVHELDRKLTAWDPQVVMMDVTGGTKLMSFGACWSALKKKIGVYYVASERGQILRGIGGPMPPEQFPIRVQIPLKAYFAAYGYHPKACKCLPFSENAVRLLLTDLRSTLRCMKSFRDIHGVRGETPKNKTAIYSLSFATEEVKQFFTDLARAGCGQVRDNNLFLNYEERELLWGKWVEIFVMRELQSLRKAGLFDEYLGETDLLNSRGEKVHQLDAAAIRCGRLMVFSCKQTKKVEKVAFDDLEGLARDLGRYASLFFVSTKKVSAFRMRSAERKGVTIIHFEDLANFKAIVSGAIRKWLIAL